MKAVHSVAHRPVTGTATRLRRIPYAASVTAAGTVLGLLAFAADLVDGVGGLVLVTLTSSGFAWGLAAILAGRYAATARSAAVGATGLLVSATALYYLLILVVSRRWDGATLQDGSSADTAALRSVAVMAAAWLAASMVGGPLLGVLGHAIRGASVRGAALAAGAAYGLLSAEGWYAAPPGDLLRLSDPVFGGVAIVRMVLPLAVLAWLTVAHRLDRAWPTLLVTAFVTAATGALLWRALVLLHTAMNMSVLGG